MRVMSKEPQEETIEQVVQLYERWAQQIKANGSMPHDDHKFWHMVDNLLPAGFRLILDQAKKSRFITAKERTWGEMKLMQVPFELRRKSDKWISGEANKNLWKILLNGFEQLQKQLKSA